MTREGPSSGQMSEEELRAAIAKQDPVRNDLRGHALIDYVLGTAKDNLPAGIEAALLGSPDTLSQVRREGPQPFWSVKARQLELFSLLLTGLISDLEKRDLYSLWSSGGPDFDREVARVLWRSAGASGSSNVQGNPSQQACAMAEVVARFIKIARNLQNGEGGYRHAYPGELIGDSHDVLKLRRAGQEQWTMFIRPLLDERTFERMDPDKFLDLAWESIVLEQDDWRLLLYFKSADGWTEYNLRFGLGTLREAVVAGIERAARRAGMYAVFGTRPDYMLDRLIRALETATKKEFDPRATARLHAIMSSLAPIWVSGLVQPPAEREITAVARNGLIDLGTALFPEHDDMPVFGRELPFRGTTLFEAIDEELRAFVFGAGISAGERRPDFAMAVAIFGNAFNAALADRFVALDSPPGGATELLRQFLKLNVTYWWTEIARRASRMALSAFLGQKMRESFAEIDPAFATVMSLYGLDAGKWDVARAAAGAISLARPPSNAAVDEARGALDAWLDDRWIAVAIGAEEAAHARFSRGAGDFTAEGELLRFLSQFRLFRAPFLPKAHGVAEVLDADKAMHRAMAEGDGLPALANLLIWTVLFARLAVLGFDVMKGDSAPTEKDDDLFDAAMFGGALGLCADLLFADTTGMKSPALSSLAELDHPGILSALRIWRQARDGDDVRAALVDWAKRHEDALDTLQVTRQALNYALLHHLQDMMSPGYLQRTVKDMKARAANSYWRMPWHGDPPDGGSLN